MPKAYWIGCIRNVFDPAKFDAYRAPCPTGARCGGGRYIARGTPAKAYDLGVTERTVIIEFPSIAAAIAAHDSPAYQAAVKALDGGIEREIRILEGLE